MFIVVIIFYSLWFILTIMNQFKNAAYRKYILKIDIFRVLPLWTFFAPNPGVSDYNLLYRIKTVDGTILPFINIVLRSNKTISNAIWNPSKRGQKALNDFVQEIRRMVKKDGVIEENQHLLKITIPYIAIIHYCSHINQNSINDSIQFTIIESFGYTDRFEPRLVFNSDFHSIC